MEPDKIKLETYVRIYGRKGKGKTETHTLRLSVHEADELKELALAMKAKHGPSLIYEILSQDEYDERLEALGVPSKGTTRGESYVVDRFL